MALKQCSFCGKREHEVAHLIVAAKAAICDECVDLCVEVNRAGVSSSGTVTVTGIGELITNDAIRSDLLGRVEDAAVAIEDGTVKWAGPAAELPARHRDRPILDCEGRAVVPGFVDAVTYVVFGGEQSDRWLEARSAGSMRLDPSGTVEATAATADQRLRDQSAERLRRMLLHGTTTAEVRSGFDPTTKGQVRSLDVIGELADVGPQLVPTLSAEWPDIDVSSLVDETLPLAAPRTRFVTLSTDWLAPADVRRLADEARHLRLGVRLSGADIPPALIDDVAPISVDDPSADVGPAMTEAGSVAVLAPGRGAAAADGRRLWDAGCLLALGTGCGPDTVWVENLQHVVGLAIDHCGLQPDEAIWAATRGGALAIDDERRGRVGRGAVGDLVVLDAPSSAHLAYRRGSNLAWRVVRGGHPIEVPR